MFSCQICEIFQNTYLEEHLRTTASKHRSSFLEVFCRSCCSALINAVMKYNFSAAVVQSWRVLHGNLQKIALHHRYFSKNFTIVAEQRYWKMYLDGCFWGRIYFEYIINILRVYYEYYDYILRSMAASQKQLQKYIRFRHSYTYFTFLTWRHVKEERIFMIFFK